MAEALPPRVKLRPMGERRFRSVRSAVRFAASDPERMMQAYDPADVKIDGAAAQRGEAQYVRARILAIIGRLPRRQAEVVVAAANGETFRHIATRLDCSYSMVRRDLEAGETVLEGALREAELLE